MIKDLNVSSLLHCKKLTKYYWYSGFEAKILNSITINTIQYDEIIAIVGKSGSGKSTLLYLMGGLDKPTRGMVFFEGKELNKLSDKDCSIIRNQRMGFIYQFHHLLSDFSVSENVAMPLLIGGVNFNTAKKRAQSVLELIGLSNRLNHYPHELSGGESQRVAIARSVINDPVLVLADEPTGNLDEKNSENIFQLLKTLNVRCKTTFVIATHDLILAKKCHKIWTISNGTLRDSSV